MRGGRHHLRSAFSFDARMPTAPEVLGDLSTPGASPDADLDAAPSRRACRPSISCSSNAEVDDLGAGGGAGGVREVCVGRGRSGVADLSLTTPLPPTRITRAEVHRPGPLPPGRRSRAGSPRHLLRHPLKLASSSWFSSNRSSCRASPEVLVDEGAFTWRAREPRHDGSMVELQRRLGALGASSRRRAARRPLRRRRTC